MTNPTLFSDSFTVSSEEKGMRIDKLLSTRYHDFSRTYFQKLFEHQKVWINDKQVKKRYLVNPEDSVTLHFEEAEEFTLEPENIPLDIIYEDEYLIAINKTANRVVHPACGNWTSTLVHGLLYHCQSIRNIGEKIRPGIVHRLDKDTTGIILAAKKNSVIPKLIHLFATRNIHKTYYAICIANPGEGQFTWPIARSPRDRKKMIAMDKGKASLTQYETLHVEDSLSFVKLSPKTGRTHQLRVHLSTAKCPILGDPLYGNPNLNKKFKVNQQLLHAYSLSFIHPITQSSMHLKAHFPRNMEKWIDKWKISFPPNINNKN